MMTQECACMDLSHNVSHTFTMINLLQVWPLEVSLYVAHLFPIGATLHRSFTAQLRNTLKL